MFPVVGGFGLMSNRASDVVANGSAQLVEGEVPQVSTMVDSKGNILAWLYSQRRFEVPSDQIANTMKLAIVSIEDKRFADHNGGVDWQGTLTGLSGYLSGNLDTRGGSTIEQQYVKNYQLLVIAQTDAEKRAAIETTPARKLREIRMALTLDKTFTKPEILTRYLNLVSFGNGASGGSRTRHRPISRQRLRAELAAGRAAGRHGAVDEHAGSLHQSRRLVGAAERGAGHHDREPARVFGRAAGSQAAAAGDPAATQGAAPPRLHRGR